MWFARSYNAAWITSREVQLPNEFEQSVYQLLQRVVIENPDLFAKTINRNCPNLGDFHPRRLGQHFRRKCEGQREAGLLRLTRDRHRDHRLGLLVEQVMAEDQNRPQSSTVCRPQRGKDIC